MRENFPQNIKNLKLLFVFLFVFFCIKYSISKVTEAIFDFHYSSFVNFYNFWRKVIEKEEKKNTLILFERAWEGSDEEGKEEKKK